MSMISEQVKRLRKLANQWKHNDVAGCNLIFEAADTIEALSAKVRNADKSTWNISQNDFGTLCICAIRYCHGRKTYMPSLVMEIVGKHLTELSDRDIKVMYDDCRFMNPSDYGDEAIDKPDWLLWEKKLKEELKRREDGEA